MLVNSIILPRVEEILSDTTELELSECQPSQDLNVSAVECFDIIEKEFVLRRYAVKMLGMLFRSRTGEAEKRNHFIGLLQKVSTTTPHGIREWVQKQDRLYTRALPLAAGETITPSGFLRGEGELLCIFLLYSKRQLILILFISYFMHCRNES